jgi:hypothetical protein
MSAIKANSAAILASGDKALRAIVRVGEGGRGFVVEGRGNERYVVTARLGTMYRLCELANEAFGRSCMKWEGLAVDLCVPKTLSALMR